MKAIKISYPCWPALSNSLICFAPLSVTASGNSADSIFARVTFLTSTKAFPFFCN